MSENNIYTDKERLDRIEDDISYLHQMLGGLDEDSISLRILTIENNYASNHDVQELINRLSALEKLCLLFDTQGDHIKNNQEKLKELEQRIKYLEHWKDDIYEWIKRYTNTEGVAGVLQEITKLEQKLDNFIEKRFVWNIDTLDNQDKEIKAVLRELIKAVKCHDDFPDRSFYSRHFFIQLLDKLGSEENKKHVLQCGNCGILFDTYYVDGEGYQSGLCPECKLRDDTIGLEKEPSELKKCPKCGKIMRDQRMKGDYLCAECYEEESPAEDPNTIHGINIYCPNCGLTQREVFTSWKELIAEFIDKLQEAMEGRFWAFRQFKKKGEAPLQVVSCESLLYIIEFYKTKLEEARKNP